MTRQAIAFFVGFLLSAGAALASKSGITYPPLQVQDEGSALTQRYALNFTGSSVSCVDDTNRTTCTISGGGATAPFGLDDGGVTGTLPIANGGTNSTSTPTAGGVAYGTGTAYAFNTAGSAGDCLKSGGAGAPTWGSCSGISAYGTVQDEGTPLTQRTTLNFIGTAISCVDNAGSTRTDCTVTASGGGLTFGEVQRLAFMAQ